ncbi:MAG: dethiobiotin synthase [Magnetococcales bacterium]|nr:dethiobiotin synthase [Magnetococcales bacterium]
MERGFFVTGTDTGVGKSVASAWLLHRWDGNYWKPVQSGAGTEEGDTAVVQRLSGLPAERFHPPAYTLALPRSPHEAANHEGITIRMDHLKLPNATPRPWVVEGAGGIMVPLNENHLMLDLMVQLELPIILVARTTLGTINHTLLSLAALRSRNLTIAGVILNGVPDHENRRAITHYGQVAILADIPLLQPLERTQLLRSG